MTKKGAIGLATVAVATALTVGLGAISSWYTNWDISTWFNRADNVTDVEKPLNADSEFVITEESNDIVTLSTTAIDKDNYDAYGVSPLAETAYTLTATVTPEDNQDSLDWRISWADVDDWTTDKNVNDYVKLSTTVSDKTVVVSYLQSFKKQIVITASSHLNSSVSANCYVDCVAKLTGITMNYYPCLGGINYSGVPITLSTDTVNVLSNSAQGTTEYSSCQWDYKLSTSGLSSITDEYTVKIYPKLNDRVMEKYIYDYLPAYASDIKSRNGSHNHSHTFTAENTKHSTNGCAPYSSQCAYHSFVQSISYDTLETFFYNVASIDEIQNTYGIIDLDVEVIGKYSTYSCTYKTTVNPKDFVKAISDIEIDDTEIIF